MGTDEIVKLSTARARPRFQCSLKRQPMSLIKKLCKYKRDALPSKKPEPVRDHLYNMIIIPEMIGSIVGVYNGKPFNQVEIKRQVRELNETEKYKNETNIDRDAVAEVFGHDRGGIVRGMGGSISKTELCASAACRELLRQEKQKTAAVENRFRCLEEKFVELRAGLTRNPNTNNANSN